MPIFNGRGELIQEIGGHERAHAEWLAAHQWPVDKDRLWHMSWVDFCKWLYVMPPREALLLSSDKEFSQFREGKKEKGQIDLAISWLWRLIWE